MLCEFVARIITQFGGETGIRTLGGFNPSTVFKTAAFDRSATSPRPVYPIGVVRIKWMIVKGKNNPKSDQ